MEYLSVKEIATKWEISIRQVQKLCAAARIVGVKRLGDGKVWLIPQNAKKPKYKRIGKVYVISK